MTVSSAAVLFLLVMDPLGNIPFFLAALAPVDPKRRTVVAIRELLLAYAVMVVFLFAGQRLLGLFQISEPALSIAGGVVLFLIALKMVFPAREGEMREELDGEPFFVPLAVPYVTGPSLLASQMLLMSRFPDRWLEWLAALTLAWLATAATVLAGNRLSSILGRRGLIALERLTGMILVAVAVQMFLNGVKDYAVQLRPEPMP